jgi:adenylate cyclase
MSELEKSTICLGCWSQMHMPIAIRGPFALPFKLVGITISKMNPNVCTVCERAFTRVKKAKQVEIVTTIVFADLRGYTSLTERIGDARVAELLRDFNDRCAEAIWRHDGIVNKTMGDGLMAIFNFPISLDDHAQRVVEAALELQRNCKAVLAELEVDEVGVGIGIHTGSVEIGEFSGGRSDYTAIGSVVNLAARLESSAGAGEILVSDAVRNGASDLCREAVTRRIEVKGFKDAVTVHTLGT